MIEINRNYVEGIRERFQNPLKLDASPQHNYGGVAI
jgi:hypothetical protein